jgi:FkbM family methyltransferase
VKKIRLDVIDIQYELTIGMGELNTIIHTNLLKDYFEFDEFTPSANSICLDIGANIGSTSLIYSKTVKDGKIFAVEPHPETYKVLLNNIEINKVTNKILPRQLSISANNGDMILFISDAGTMAMKPGQYKWEGKNVSVPTITLDTFIKNEKINKIDILKIDIEGYENQALKCATKTLQLTKRVVLEYHSAELKQRCLEILAQNGFETYEKGSLIYSWKS